MEDLKPVKERRLSRAVWACQDHQLHVWGQFNLQFVEPFETL
jgi:hypothetical protein